MDFVACCLRNFNCTDYIEPIEVKSKEKFDFYIEENGGEFVSLIIDSFRYKEMVGGLEVQKLINNYGCIRFIENSITDPKKRWLNANDLLISAQLFSTALWFIKDNSITPSFTTISSDNIYEPLMIRSNVNYTDSKGNNQLTSYSISEIKAAEKWYEILNGFSHYMEAENLELNNNVLNTYKFIPLDTPSFQRGLQYLESARRIEYLPSKIATYITVLELLFCVKGENTHKVAERTATFIGKNNDERIKVYNEISLAYDIRSKYVHGSEIKNNKKELLPNISENLDSVVRIVLSEMIVNYPELNYKNKKDKNNANSKDAEDVNTWFNNLVLSRE